MKKGIISIYIYIYICVCKVQVGFRVAMHPYDPVCITWHGLPKHQDLSLFQYILFQHDWLLRAF